MTRLIRYLPILLAALLLSGCAGFAKQAYNPSAAEPIKQVLIVTPPEFPKVGLGLAGSPGLFFGAIGAGIAAANAQSQGETLDQALNSQGGGYPKQLLATLDSSFNAAGIRTQTIALPRDGRTGLLEDYKSVAAQRNVDAILDIFVWEASYGGTHPIFDPDKRPIIRLRARLVSAKTQQVLYADDIFFGFTNPFMEAREIKSPKKYYFPDVEALNNDKPRAAEGMRVAATEVARFLVNQLTAPQSVAASK